MHNTTQLTCNATGCACPARACVRTRQASVDAAKVFDNRCCPVVLPGDEQRAVAVHSVERLLVEEPDQTMRVDLHTVRCSISALRVSANAVAERVDVHRRERTPCCRSLSSIALNHLAKPALVLSSTVRSGADSARLVSMLGIRMLTYGYAVLPSLLFTSAVACMLWTSQGRNTHSSSASMR